MTWDSGGAILLGSFGTVVLIWIGNLVVKHFTNNEDAAEKAHERINVLDRRVDDFERDYLRSQTKAAETYARISGVERMETNIFAVLARLEQKIDDMKSQGVTHHG
jgi:hypothetical protein